MRKFLPIILVISCWLFLLPNIAFAATLSLSPATGTFNKGCPVTLEVKLDTGGVETDGTDAIILYDQSKFTATANSITSGTIYGDFPGNNVDDAKGQITISGLASVSSAFSGVGTLATINFTVKDAAAAGATVVSFLFDPQNKAKTTDSNVVKRGDVVDVLNAVADGNYIIGTGSCTASPPPQGAVLISTPSAQQQPIFTPPPRKTLPEGGTEQFTYTVAIVGSILTVLGILGIALL